MVGRGVSSYDAKRRPKDGTVSEQWRLQWNYPPPSTPRFALTEMAVILNFGSETMSGNARSDIFKSDMVDNMGIAVGISAP
jgi:hypothetical protein